MVSAHRGAPYRPGPSASSSSSVAPPFAAPQRGEVARACEPVCGVPCNFWVARDRAAQQNAAVEGAVSIAQEEAPNWDHGMSIYAPAVAAVLAARTRRKQRLPMGGLRRRQPSGKQRLLAKPVPPRKLWRRRRRR